jgi:leucyl aminopeptidase
MPLWQPYRPALKSFVADQRNISPTSPHDTLLAALFLESFTGGLPWAHIDMPGTAFHTQETPFWPEGATGSPVRALVRFVEDRAGQKETNR